MKATPTIRRVKCLQPSYFRGFAGSNVRLDTDADLVLITGPNGFGKTSLIDALCTILTGHHYSDREPLVCGTIGAREAMISAEVETWSGEDMSIVAKIAADNRVSCQAGPWTDQTPDSRQLAARASFFYQDILGYLFEEDSAEVKLENFLITTPVSITSIMDTLKKNRDTVDAFIRNLQSSQSIPTKAEIDLKRALAAADVEKAWEDAEKSPYFRLCSMSIPSRPVLTRNEGNTLAVRWKESLGRLARECNLNISMDDSVMKDRQPDVLALLDQITRYAQRVHREVDEAIGEEELKQRNLIGLMATVADIEIVLTEEQIGCARSRADELMRLERQLKSDTDAILELERHFKPRPNGHVSLADVVDALREMGTQWLSVPSAQPGLEVPNDVVSWLNEAVRQLDKCHPPVDDQLHTWSGILTERRVTLERNRESLAEALRSLRESINGSCRVLDLAGDLEDLRVAIEGLTANGKNRIMGKELVSLLSVNPEYHSHMTNPMGHVINCLSVWSELEKEELQHEEQRRQSSTYRAVHEGGVILKQALDQECSKRTSVIANLELVSPDSQINFARDVNRIMNSFYSVPGVLPVKLDRVPKGRQRIWAIKSSDGRGLSSLSSGQKAQLAISLVLALNIALREMLWFDVVAFDDFTSALDMTQLPRLAALVRQVAYGNPHQASDEAYLSRQVFIVSHHEDLTNKLISFLVPPHGKKMRVLNFTNWDPLTGPEIEQLEVEPNCPINSARDQLSGVLDEILSEVWRG